MNIISKIIVHIKNWIVNILKGYWHLNWEARIGILFLIPPIFGAFAFIFNHNYFRYADTPAIPLYLGLMAIAGAYLIKGNLKKEE